MERFVRLVVAGGVVLVAGLWAARFVAGGTPAWLGALSLAAAGCAAVLAGIYHRLDIDA